MYLTYHGGKCCGIKTIHSLGYNPAQNLPILPVRANKEGYTSLFYAKELPEQTAEERFTTLVKHWDSNVSRGILEVILQDAGAYNVAPEKEHMYNQQLNWRPVLKKLGFKLIASCKNSNSGNRIYVFHKTKDDATAKKAKGE
jgi:hypothetical protein